MASAMELEKFLTNSPYLPSFEYLTRSRHRGSAIDFISSSVFSIMFTRGSLRPEGTGAVGRTALNMLISLYAQVGAQCERLPGTVATRLHQPDDIKAPSPLF